MRTIIALLAIFIAVPVVATPLDATEAEKPLPPGVSPVAPVSSHSATAPAPVVAPPKAPAVPVSVAPPVNPEADVGGFTKALFSAVTAKNWRYLAVLILIGVVAGVRRFSRKVAALSFLNEGKWAWATAVFVGLGGAVGTALAAGAPVTLDLMILGATNGVIAAGLVKGVTEWRDTRPVEPVPPPIPPQA